MGSHALLLRRPAAADAPLVDHAERVTQVARAIAERLGCSRRQLAALELGGPLHDIGKLTIAEPVLLKPTRLDPHELLQIRGHPQAGARLLDGVRPLRTALPCVLYHHERWDGTGYPHGLAGTDIPVVARILSVADAFDAMTSNRPYRAALPVEYALAEVRRCAGSQFDPQASLALLAAWHAGEIASAPA